MNLNLKINILNGYLFRFPIAVQFRRSFSLKCCRRNCSASLQYENNWRNSKRASIQAAQGSPVCITSDGWTHMTGGVHLVSITLHYIDNSWVYKVLSKSHFQVMISTSQEAVLATKPVQGAQTAITMADMIRV